MLCLIGCLVVAVGAPGCGSKPAKPLSRAEYQSKLQEAFASRSPHIFKLTLRISRLRDAATAREGLEQLATELSTIAASLEAIEPPRDAADTNSELVRGLSQLAAWTKAKKAHIPESTMRPLAGFETEFASAPGAQRAAHAAQELDAAGYRLAPAGG